MTTTSRNKIVQYLENGATLREAAAMTGVPWREFEAEWLEAQRLHNVGHKGAAARWYRDASAGRARFRADLRLQARQEAGDRSSADALALLKRLEDEPDPEMTDEQLRATIPPIEVWTEEAKNLADNLLRALAGGPKNPRRDVGMPGVEGAV